MTSNPCFAILNSTPSPGLTALASDWTAAFKMFEMINQILIHMTQQDSRLMILVET